MVALFGHAGVVAADLRVFKKIQLYQFPFTLAHCVIGLQA
jgi:hypothetical protein